MFESLAKKFQEITSRIGFKRRITEANVEEALREIRVALLGADVAFSVVRDFLAQVKEEALGLELTKGVTSGQEFVYIVHRKLVDLMGPVDTRIARNPDRPTVILMAGLQGSGKTTTCGKLGLYLREKEGRKPMLVAADVQRPAAVEQLQIVGSRLDIPVYREAGVRPPAICRNAIEQAVKSGRDTVILDTAGRLHIDEEMMDEVSEIARATSPDEIFLVCDAMTGQDAVRSAAEFNRRLELTGVFLTKLDGDERGGAALTVKAVTGKPIKYVGVGERAENFEPFRPEGMASRILGMGDIVGLVEKAREQVDAEKQQEMLEKLLRKQFTLNDFLGQLQAMKRMGTMRDLLKHIPGVGTHIDDMDIDDREIDRVEAVIRSMTPGERQRPEILNTSRRERIARGSGQELATVNDLLRQFKDMQKVMGKLSEAKGVFGKMRSMASLRKALSMENVAGMMQQAVTSDGNLRVRKKAAAAPKGPSREEIKRRRKEERRRRKKARRHR